MMSNLGYIGGTLGGEAVKQSFAAAAQHSCDTVQQDSAIDSDLCDVRAGINRIDVLLGCLAQRLSSVLLPSPPAGQGCGNAVPTPMRSPLGSEMANEARRLQALCDAVEGVMARLEV